MAKKIASKASKKRVTAPPKKTIKRVKPVTKSTRTRVRASVSKRSSNKNLFLVAILVVISSLALLVFTQLRASQRNSELSTENCRGVVDHAPDYCAEMVACAASTHDDCYSETPETLGATTIDFAWPIRLENWPATTNPIVNCDLIYDDRTISTGLEIAAPVSTRVYSAATGTVKLAEMRNGYGVIIIDTGIPSSAGGGKTVRINYNYLASIVGIMPGNTVQKGQYIATTGNSAPSGALKGKPGLHFGIWRTVDSDGVVAGHVPYFSSSTATTISEPAKALTAKIYHPMNFLPQDGRNLKDCDTTKKPGEFYVPGTGSNVLQPGGGTPTPTPTPTPGTIFKVYMNPKGNDANDGLSPSKPVLTLARVHQIINKAQPNKNIEIRIKKGTYIGQTMVWRYFDPIHTISFMPDDYSYGETIKGIAGRPVFDGKATNGSVMQWMIDARTTKNGNTNLRFYFIEVKKYAEGGIRVHGGYHNVNNLRRGFSTGANKNTFYGLYMHHMGSVHTNRTAYGAIDLVNSRNNKIMNNVFENLENKDQYGNQARVHAIYFAHQSNNNIVNNNVFRRVSGDPIRVRNDSNNNAVRSNIFRYTAETTAFGDWFEDNASPKECASHGNIFRNNDLGTNYFGRTLRPVATITGGSNYAGSHKDCTNSGQPRFMASNNN